MKSTYSSAKVFAHILAKSEQKIKVLSNFEGHMEAMNCDPHATVTTEIMEGGIIRYTIKGFRSEMRICYSTRQDQIIRQPRGLKVSEFNQPNDWFYISDLRDVIAAAKKEREELASWVAA